MMKKKWISVFIINLLSLYCVAQADNYKYFYLLDSITTEGLYSIKLSPEINAHSKIDHSDIRIVNKEGHWVPHIFNATIAKTIVKEQVINQSFVITENTKLNTEIIIGPVVNIVADIGLIIKNTAAQRFCTISGSDDKKNWFVINDSLLLDPGSDEKLTSKILRINFPPSKYAFFKITIGNNHKDPFNISGVVFYQTSTTKEQNNSVQNPATSFTVKDSGKITYIKVTQQNAYHFNTINIKISAPKYYNRAVSVYIPAAGSTSYHDDASLLQSFTISNKSNGQFNVPICNAPVFFLLISNEDNLPLTVTEVSTAADYAYLTAYLEKGDGYKLILDNAAAAMPNYDLSSFNKTSSDSIQFLLPGNIHKVAEKVVVIPPVKNQQWILWGAIIIALILLTFFTTIMVKEVNKKKQHDSL